MWGQRSQVAPEVVNKQKPKDTRFEPRAGQTFKKELRTQGAPTMG